MNDQLLRARLHEMAAQEWTEEERQALYSLDYLFEVLRSRSRDWNAERVLSKRNLFEASALF